VNRGAPDGHNLAHAVRADRLPTLLPTLLPCQVRYEDMVRDQRVTSTAALAALGLDWEPSLETFFATERPVHTMSSAQVRRSLFLSVLAGKGGSCIGCVAWPL